jgi:protein tyrosine phosphatase (PTP) superfamily phosphohydrolase (DUF442 family)
MDISQITDHLYVGSRLGAEELEALRQLDVRLIINMIAYRRPPRGFASLPAAVLWLRTFDFPLLPIPVRTLARGVEAALPVIQDGHCVLVYCEGGRHRSVAMATAILIGQGHAADEAMQLVSEGREVADPWAWHIERQIRKFEAYWRSKGR